MSVLLSFYELLASNDLVELRNSYLNDQSSFFVKLFLQSLDKDFDQPYRVLEKLASHLSYNCKEIYGEICESLPFPANIEANASLRSAYATIQLNYYKLLKYSSQEDKAEKMNIVFQVVEKYFRSLNFDKDINRKKLLDLYIVAEEADKGLSYLEVFDNKEDPFILQNTCKLYRLKGDLPNALKCIQAALDNAIGFRSFHKAAFLHDKAVTLKELNDQSCLSVLREAIELQNSKMTRATWLEKLSVWEQEFSNL